MISLRALKARYVEAHDPLRSERRIELFVIFLFLLLLLQLLYGVSSLAVLSTPKPILPAADSLEVTPPVSRDSVAAKLRKEIRNRPLFWPERRPVEDVPEVPELEDPSEREFKDFKLLGVFGTGESVGIIAVVKGNSRRIHVGEVVDGWKLESVENNNAIFTAGSRREKAVLQHEIEKSAAKAEKRRERRR